MATQDVIGSKHEAGKPFQSVATRIDDSIFAYMSPGKPQYTTLENRRQYYTPYLA